MKNFYNFESHDHMSPDCLTCPPFSKMVTIISNEMWAAMVTLYAGRKLCHLFNEEELVKKDTEKLIGIIL